VGVGQRARREGEGGQVYNDLTLLASAGRNQLPRRCGRDKEGKNALPATSPPPFQDRSSAAFVRYQRGKKREKQGGRGEGGKKKLFSTSTLVLGHRIAHRFGSGESERRGKGKGESEFLSQRAS